MKSQTSDNSSPSSVTDVGDDVWSDMDTQLMVSAAHRYCLGRQTYIVGAAIDWLWKNRHHFSRNTIGMIVRDTVEALQDNRAGSEYLDAPGWRSLASRLYTEMPEEDQRWVRTAVAHRNEDWPLVDEGR